MINKLEELKKLVDSGEYDLAISNLESLKDLPSKEERYSLLLLAYSQYKIRKYDSAIKTANAILQKNNKIEYASQIKYLSLCELKRYDEALEEIIEFLSSNNAILYKVTLEELLNDINNGFINEASKIEKIKNIARRNNLTV